MGHNGSCNRSNTFIPSTTGLNLMKRVYKDHFNSKHFKAVIAANKHTQKHKLPVILWQYYFAKSNDTCTMNDPKSSL